MIESVANEKIKYANKLKLKKYRNLYNQFLIEGEHLLVEALNTNSVEMVFTTEDVTYKGVDTYQISEEVMLKLSDLDESSGVVAICKKPSTKPLSNRVLILDQVQDPGNMGTLIRTAAAFGFSTILAEKSVDFYNDKVIRSTQGTLFYVDLREGDIVSFMREHPEMSYFGTSVTDGVKLNEVSFNEPFAVILGNEGSGVRPEIQSLVHTNVNIPMDSTESLNVAIAGGIIMYQSSRRK